jgi:hypothetical protein
MHGPTGMLLPTNRKGLWRGRFCAHVKLAFEGPFVDDLRTHHGTTSAFVAGCTTDNIDVKLCTETRRLGFTLSFNVATSGRKLIGERIQRVADCALSDGSRAAALRPPSTPEAAKAACCRSFIKRYRDAIERTNILARLVDRRVMHHHQSQTRRLTASCMFAERQAIAANRQESRSR